MEALTPAIDTVLLVAVLLIDAASFVMLCVMVRNARSAVAAQRLFLGALDTRGESPSLLWPRLLLALYVTIILAIMVAGTLTFILRPHIL